MRGAVGGHWGQGRVGKGSLGLAVPADTRSSQGPARAAAPRASTPAGSVSVTSSVLTTRAAVPTSWPSASPKVRAERLGGPGVSGAAGDSPPPSLPAVTRGDVFHLPEDEYRFFDYNEAQTVDLNVEAQPESPTLVPVLQAETQETPVQAPVLSPEKEAPLSGRGDSEPEVGTSDPGISESPADEETCSGKPFDAFTDLKNGSLFAFRGDSRWAGLGGRGLSQGHPPSHDILPSRAVLL